MTALAGVEGRTYGPVTTTPTAEATRRYVTAVADDIGRWTDAAPPSWAGALLFTVAPDFLADPDVAAHGGGVVHAEQTFVHHRPFSHGVPLAVTGSVDRVRLRGGNAWVSFSLVADGPDGRVLDAGSTFVVTGAVAPGVEPRPEPGVHDRGPHDPAGAERSASRADLVAYAAASGDLNPIHWDHESAVAAGLPGVVCHGLLLSAWCSAALTRDVPGDRPLGRSRTRFRSPVPAAAACVIDVDGGAVALRHGEAVAVALDGEVTP